MSLWVSTLATARVGNTSSARATARTGNLSPCAMAQGTSVMQAGGADEAS